MPRTEATTGYGWRPGTDRAVLELRATLLGRVRQFFSERGVLEVDTPHLARGATTDPAIESFQTCYQGPGSAGGETLFLHTSPEFAMKRLLVAGSGPIYQLCHVFRNAEFGRRHNPEFMMLEWYRPGFDQQALMGEVDALLDSVLDGLFDYQSARRISYRQWFVDGTGLDPWVDGIETFMRFAHGSLDSVPETMPNDELDPWLDLLITHWLEPRLDSPAVFVYDYPPSQASLARLRHRPLPVAERFELYLQGMEVANGFSELADGAEQLRRFEADNRLRAKGAQTEMPVDDCLVSALKQGLPDCCGVAVGFDRVLMIAAGIDDIDAAIPFSLKRI